MKFKKNQFLVCACLFFFVSFFFFPALAHAGESGGVTEGQSIYVPAYSHIYSGNEERPFLLTVTLSIRNIDPNHGIEISRVDYYETQGHHLKKFVESPVTLSPLESLRYVIPEKDKSGGSGANFIVEWNSKRPVNAPIVESIMIGTQTQQGISFTSRGKVILETGRGENGAEQ